MVGAACSRNFQEEAYTLNTNSSYLGPLFIILIGIGYLLYNMGIIAISPWQALITYWPLFVIYHGLKTFVLGLFQWRGKDFGDMLLGAVVAFFGFNWLAPRIGLSAISLSWSMLWPIFIILLGLSLLFDSKKVLSVQVLGDDDKDHDKLPSASASLIGEVRRGATSWALDDTTIRHAIGSVHLDLTQAIIPEREVKINIAGMIGEATIYLPPDLPVRIECRLYAGEMSVLDRSESGANLGPITMESPGYAEAVKKLNIRVHWRIGDVKIRRIG
jgi:lia operon protein LiaF